MIYKFFIDWANFYAMGVALTFQPAGLCGRGYRCPKVVRAYESRSLSKTYKNVVSRSYKILMGRPENFGIAYPLLTLPCKREMGSAPVRLEDSRVERRGIERMGVAIIEDDGRTHPPIKNVNFSMTCTCVSYI